MRWTSYSKNRRKIEHWTSKRLIERLVSNLKWKRDTILGILRTHSGSKWLFFFSQSFLIFPEDLSLLSVKHPNQMLIIESFNTPTQTDFMLQLVHWKYIEISFVARLIPTPKHNVDRAAICCGLVSFYPWSHPVTLLNTKK